MTTRLVFCDEVRLQLTVEASRHYANLRRPQNPHHAIDVYLFITETLRKSNIYLKVLIFFACT